jgi:hypothetical protein
VPESRFKTGDVIYYTSWDSGIHKAIVRRFVKSGEVIVDYIGPSRKGKGSGEVIVDDTDPSRKGKGMVIFNPMTKEEAFAKRLRG